MKIIRSATLIIMVSCLIMSSASVKAQGVNVIVKKEKQFVEDIDEVERESQLYDGGDVFISWDFEFNYWAFSDGPMDFVVERRIFRSGEWARAASGTIPGDFSGTTVELTGWHKINNGGPFSQQPD